MVKGPANEIYPDPEARTSERNVPWPWKQSQRNTPWPWKTEPKKLTLGLKPESVKEIYSYPEIRAKIFKGSVKKSTPWPWKQSQRCTLYPWPTQHETNRSLSRKTNKCMNKKPTNPWPQNPANFWAFLSSGIKIHQLPPRKSPWKISAPKKPYINPAPVQ